MNRLRGIVHSHSEFSFDSSTPLHAIKALAVARGLSFVVQTEHSNAMTAAAHARYVAEARALSDSSFLMLPGIEYATSDNSIHVLVLGVEEFWEELRLCDPDRLGELLARARSVGGFTVLAHPERANAIDRVSPEALALVDAIEIWNGKTDRLGPSPRGARELARRRRGGRPAPALAGLDLHRPEDFRPVGIELTSTPQNEAELLRRIREMSFRVFFGPVRWDASQCGGATVVLGRVTKSVLDGARAVKRRIR